MRIGIIANADSVHTQKIANGLASRGHDVYVYSLPNHMLSGLRYATSIKQRSLTIPGKAGYVLNAYKLKKLLISDRIEVVNAHYASGYGTLAAFAAFHPYALSVWGSDIYLYAKERKYKQEIIKHNLARADMIFSTSNALAEETLELAPHSEVKITPFGVDTEFFIAERTSVEGQIRIGFIKSISHVYGLEYLLEAISILQTSNLSQQVSLDIYGDGDQTEKMKDLAFQLGISRIVRFHGRIPNSAVPKALSNIDIFCVPSVSESFGVAAIEAMSCEVPCVTSDTPGLLEVMVNGITGFVVPGKNPKALAEKLLALVNDKALRVQMGRLGRQHVLKHYNWNENLSLFEEALLSLQCASKSENL